MMEISDTPLAQMDVWMERDVKLRGDAVLARAGYTPAQAVRALWRIAVLHEDDVESLAALLAESEQELPCKADQDGSGIDAVASATEEMRDRIMHLYGNANLEGITFPPVPGPPGTERS